MSEPAEAPWLSPQLLGLTALLLESHQRLFQRPLVRSNGIRLAAQELFVLDQVVLCHDGSEDPPFSMPTGRPCSCSAATGSKWWACPHG